MRVIPLTGSEAFRKVAQAAGVIKAAEIHTTDDQFRVFLQGLNVAPVWHGVVADEAAMLELTNSSRGVWPADFCKRADTDSVWFCITNNGETADDWIEAAGLGAAGTDTINGGTAADEFDDILNGGTAADEFPNIINGNVEE